MFERRIAELERKLDASTDRGKPKPGYKVRVDALRAELARLETLRTATPTESGEANPGVDTSPAPA